MDSLKQSIKKAITNNSKFIAKKVWPIKREENLAGDITMMIEVTVKRKNKIAKEIIQPEKDNVINCINKHLETIQAGLEDVKRVDDYAIKHVASQMKFAADDSIKLLASL